jgi:glycosyltransferase involved in cell wall biosynthesis
LHVHGEVASGLCLPSLALRASVVTINGLHLVRRLGGWRRTAAEANLRLIVRAASATICVSEAELDHVRGVVGDRGKLVLIPNGVDPKSIDQGDRDIVRGELGLSPADVFGVVVAALDSHKEPLVAARAALEATGLVLVFVGDGPLRAELVALAGTNPAIRVLGYRSDSDRVLAAADFFVLPSRREGLSFALLEAMSLGLPPVVSDEPANMEAVGDAGVVVSTGDVAGFAVAMRRLASDAALRQELGARARRRVATRFSADEMRRRTADVYDALFAEDRRRRYAV